MREIFKGVAEGAIEGVAVAGVIAVAGAVVMGGDSSVEDKTLPHNFDYNVSIKNVCNEIRDDTLPGLVQLGLDSNINVSITEYEGANSCIVTGPDGEILTSVSSLEGKTLDEAHVKVFTGLTGAMFTLG